MYVFRCYIQGLYYLTALISVVLTVARADASLSVYGYNSAFAVGTITYTLDSGFSYESVQRYNDNIYNYTTNGEAQATGYASTYVYPQIIALSHGTNETDFSTYVNVRSSASSYSNATSAFGYSGSTSTGGTSSVNMIFSDASKVLLSLELHAHSSGPGSYGYSQAQSFLEIYNYVTNELLYQLSATSTNGDFGQSYAEYIDLILSPGQYQVRVGTYTSGTSYNSAYIDGSLEVSQQAYANVRISSIESIPGQQSSVPEPASLFAWSSFAFLGLAARLRLAIGDRVKILRGALAGLFGRVFALTADNQCVLSLDGLRPGVNFIINADALTLDTPAAVPK